MICFQDRLHFHHRCTSFMFTSIMLLAVKLRRRKPAAWGRHTHIFLSAPLTLVSISSSTQHLLTFSNCIMYSRVCDTHPGPTTSQQGRKQIRKWLLRGGLRAKTAQRFQLASKPCCWISSGRTRDASCQEL